MTDRTHYCPGCKDRQDEIDRLRAELAKAREALTVLATEAVLLLNNAEGCAQNHYGEDFDLHGMPGWLADAREKIATARTTLEAMENRT